MRTGYACRPSAHRTYLGRRYVRRARSLGRAVRTPQYRGTAQAPHLPKISDYLVARLRDKDSTRELREACAAALGALVAELGPDAPPVVLRYLLPVLGETLEPVRLQPYVPEAATPWTGACGPCAFG